MFEFITSWMTEIGSLGVGLLMLLENVFPPIPSELIMPFAGFLAASGDLNLFAVIVAGTTGAVAGAMLWYWIGLLVSEVRLRGFICRYGRWLTLSENDFDKSLAWFEKHGGKAVFFGRMVPGIRTLISLPAGLTRMPLAPFLLYTTLGSFFWTTALTMAGYLLTTQFTEVEVWLSPVTKILVIGILTLYVWRLLRPQRFLQ